MEGEDRDSREVVITPMADSCSNANDEVNDGVRLIHIHIFIHRIRLLVTGTINIVTRYGGWFCLTDSSPDLEAGVPGRCRDLLTLQPKLNHQSPGPGD